MTDLSRQRCLVMRGHDSFGRPVLCFAEAKVVVSSRSTRRREVCISCAEDLCDKLASEGFSARMMPHAMRDLLNH